MRADDREFPVIIRDSVVERHWCTAPEVTAPSIARATCWVRSAARGYEGWLMPRHAGDPLSAVVSFSDGGSGKLLDHFGECIDSVVISSNAGAARRDAHKSLLAAPARAGVAVHGQPPGSHKAVTVIDADLNLGVLHSAIFPIRFSTDWVRRVPGDSGALIVKPSRGERRAHTWGSCTRRRSGMCHQE